MGTDVCIFTNNNAHTGAVMRAGHQFLYNTRTVISKANDKTRPLQRLGITVTPLASLLHIYVEVLQHMLAKANGINNLSNIHIPTTSFD